MIAETHDRYAVHTTHNFYRATVIVTGFLQRLSRRFLLPESNFLLELSHFLVHSSLREGNGSHQLLELRVDTLDNIRTLLSVSNLDGGPILT